MNKLSLESAFQSFFHKQYLFEDFCNIEISKEYKEIFYSKNTFSPSKKLKDFQRFLNLFIFEYLPINEKVVFSYRKTVNAKDAILPHSKNKYILSTDIKSFFASMNVDKLKDIFSKNIDNFLINDSKTHSEHILNLVTYNGILPVGSPSSPLISNGYLFELDNSLENYCTNHNITYTRYSDDFIFSSNNEEELKNIINVLQKMFIDCGFSDFEINERKTKFQKQGFKKIVLLGLVLTHQGFITVDNKHKKEIEILLHFYLTDKEKFINYFANNFSSNIDKVSGLLSYINSVDNFYISKLRKKYGSFIVNSFIHRDINVKF
jgi:RNA-directed DNA polymerase